MTDKAIARANDERAKGMDVGADLLRPFQRARRARKLDVDVDEIIEPVAELHSLVGLGCPCRAGIAEKI